MGIFERTREYVRRAFWPESPQPIREIDAASKRIADAGDRFEMMDLYLTTLSNEAGKLPAQPPRKTNGGGE